MPPYLPSDRVAHGDRCCFESCKQLVYDDTMHGHYVRHVQGLLTEDLPEGSKKPRLSKKCPFCKPPQNYVDAVSRVADHIINNHHQGESALRCPLRCNDTVYARLDARLRHRKTACKKCAGCGSSFETAAQRIEHEMGACSQVDDDLKNMLKKMLKGNEKKAEKGSRTEAAAEGQGRSKRQRPH